MMDIDFTPIYRVIVCTKLEERFNEIKQEDGTIVKEPAVIPLNYGCRENFGFFHEKENAIMAVRMNACDIWETCYDYAIVEEIGPGLYSRVKNCWLFKYDRELDEYIQFENPDIFNKIVWD